MAIRVALQHRTEYKYDRPISLGPQVVRLRPCIHARTPVHNFSMQVEPGEQFLNWQQDANGNFLGRLVFPEKTDIFSVDIDLVIDWVVFNPFDFFLEESAQEAPFTYDKQVAEDLRPYLVRADRTKALSKFLEAAPTEPAPTVDFLVALNQYVQNAIDYTVRMEPGVQTPATTLRLGRGSCRDSAWLLVHLLRRIGLAARFVSGYLIQLTPDKDAVDGPNGAAEDFCDLHAWTEVYVPGAGWIGLDPTSGLLAGEGHIPLACAASPTSAAPISGAHEEAEVEFTHTMKVTRVRDTGRAGRPYADEQWQAIKRCGNLVDQRLRQQDVRLTVGGEPTFVGSRNPDADEWNTAALGPTKAGLADHLVRRLVGHWGPGAMLHHGQGKWYPGEELPRWAWGAVWRRDGVPVWRDPSLQAKLDQDYAVTPDDAAAFAAAVAEQLQVPEDRVFTAYEDPFYYAWRERQLPANVDPLKNNIDDPRERRRITEIFRRGIGTPVGSVLPLAWRGGWVTGDWFLREERCYLMPGDSAMGLRLPLDSQPWWAKKDRDPFFPADPTQPAQPLDRVPRQQAARWPGKLEPLQKPEEQESATTIVRSALCVEPRDGILRVFLPPINEASAFLRLITAIENVAAEQQQPVLLEGYEAPHHELFVRMAVTPDPGVIEVNVPPVASWPEQVAQYETLYDEAHQLHLAPEKFDVDGKHTGTGGGCHIVAGGAKPSDSPWLRRPAALGNLIAFWLNHPSLTYVFSGAFVGPTSQAPRLDEARTDAVAEMELALAQLPGLHQQAPPWLVDRILRNLLIDVTGNTHRAEICIDKLYSPDGPTGRLGLLELRSFEMPPHPQMALAQHLLIRSLISYFWDQEVRQPLARWGTMLHDKWLLPTCLDHDMQQVCAELQAAGLPVQAEWFAPHSDFRMPRLGSFTQDGVTMSLRQAIEPWHVLGEEATAGGQARYVDSSCERLEIRVSGATDRRHSVLCNGYRLPLQPTGVAGEAVAGVRFRAWQPPSCLHPTIGIDSPLRFDVFDEWSQRAVGGLVYHVMHPGGRSFETRPINSNEAEGRRVQRVTVDQHSQGTHLPLAPVLTPEAPFTLDLRRSAPTLG